MLLENPVIRVVEWTMLSVVITCKHDRLHWYQVSKLNCPSIILQSPCKCIDLCCLSLPHVSDVVQVHPSSRTMCTERRALLLDRKRERGTLVGQGHQGRHRHNSTTS